METPKANNKTLSESSSSSNPNCNKVPSPDAQIAAQKLDDLIEGQRKDSSRRMFMERQQSRRLTSLASRRNLMAASPSMSIRKTRSETLRSPSGRENIKNPPGTMDSSAASKTVNKEPSGNHDSPRMSKTAENLQRDLEAKAHARGLRSSASIRNMMGSSPPSVRNIGANKPPPQSPEGMASAQPRPPRRIMSRGDAQPSRIPHFSPRRLKHSAPTPRLEDSISSFDVQMGGLKSASRSGMDSSTSAASGINSGEAMLSSSTSVSALKPPPPSSFRRNNFARESSMSVLRRSATTSNSRDLDQLIAYKTGIPLEEDDNNDDTETQKPPAVAEGGAEDAVEENGVVPPSPGAYAATPRPPTTGSLSGLTNNRDLDEIIAYKTGIPLHDSNHEDVEQTTEQAVPGAVMGTGQATKNADYANHQVAKRPEIGADASMAAPEGKGGKYDPEGAPGCFDNDWIQDIEEHEEDLAIAIEIQEENEDAFIPSAIEYDPEAKPPIYKNRRFRFYCTFLFVLVTVVVVGVVGITQFQTETLPQADLPEDEESTEAQSISSIIELVVDEEKLADVDGPHYAALDWITNQDQLQVGVTDTGHLIQRYILALFSFQTSDMLQNSCGATNSVTNKTFGENEHECLFQQLHSVYPHKYKPVPSYRWLSRTHECEWAGIRCDEDGNVRVIDLSGQYIVGFLPIEFKELRFLQSLMLSWNQLTGTIPEEYGSMQYLVNFEASFNDLTGTLPEWTDTRNLQLINVGANSLSGTIPTFIKNLPNLGGFYIYDNAFRGPIPEEIGYVSNLKFLRLSKNFLTGTLPTTIGLLNPNELGLSKLELHGTLPTELGKMVGLKKLQLQSTAFHGTIPEELFNLTALKRLDMYDSDLSGTLSTNIGKLTDLRELRINDNKFTGSLPTELGDLPKLADLWVYGNEFDGAVPLEVCSLKENASLEAVHADCLPMNSTGLAQIACDCCDTCCNPGTKTCIAMSGLGEQEG